MRFLASIRLIRVVLALAVSFWMAGAGCILGCDSMIAAAASITPQSGSIATVVSGEACASMQSHDCCAKQGGKRQPTSGAEAKNPQTATTAVSDLGGTSGPMMDCPLAANATAALSKAKQDQSDSELLLTRTIDFNPPLREQVSALSAPARLPNRGHTYLQCCVFLI